MGADIVIAVDLNSDVVAAWRNARVERPPKPRQRLVEAAVPLRAQRARRRRRPDRAAEGLPSMLTVMQSSISIMSVRIARSRLAGEPADVLISPRLAQLG
jgi:NTE family protein